MFRWRNFVFLGLPFILLIPLLVWASITLYRQTLRDVVSERDEQTARVAAAALSDQLNRRAEIIRGIAEQAAVSDDFDLLLSSIGFLDADFDAGIAIFDFAGEPLAVRNAQPADVTTWPFPASTTSPFSPFQHNRQTGQPQMRVIATNEVVQVVGAFDPTAMANDVLAGVLAGNRPISAFIVNAEGERICTIGIDPDALLGSEQQFCISEALSGKQGSLYPTGGDNESVVAFSPIEPVGWALVTEEPLQTASNPRLTALLFAPLIIVPVLLLALWAIWFGDRQIWQPLHQLEKQAAALGRGQFNLIETEVGGIEAVRRLQSELVQMAHKVARAQSNFRTQVGAITHGREEERRRLARELHDDTIQSLIALNQRVQLTQLRAAKDSDLTQDLAMQQRMIADLIGDVRQFTHALRPIGLEELGLIPALELLVENTRKSQVIEIDLTTIGEPQRLISSAEFALYRITQEAVTNVLKHAVAEQVLIVLRFNTAGIILTIEDDGDGFIVPSNVAEMAAQGQFGLLGIHERVELIGATVQIESVIGDGSLVTVRLDSAEI